MAGIKISALPAAPSASLIDIFPAVQTGVTVKETLQQILTLFNSNIQLSSPSQVTGLNSQLATYLPLSGGTMAGALFLNTNSPSNSLEAASKGYVDTVASGFTVILAADFATTANLNATPAGAGVGATLTNAGAMAAFSVDGASPSVNQRILVKDQTLSQHNGVYNLTTVGSGAVNWVLTRSTDYDQSTEIKPGTLIAVNGGTVNASTSWIETATVVTVDTDPVLFSQFTFAPSGFLMVANNLSDVASVSTSRTNLGLGTAATKTASDNTKTNVAMVNGAPSVGNIAVFSDVQGTVEDGGPPLNLLFNFMSTGRLTLTSGAPVTTTDVTAAPIIYYAPYTGNQISLFDGASTWNTLSFNEIVMAVPGTANTVYDVFIYNNLGTCSMEFQAWVNDTTRAISLSLQNGVYVKSSDSTRRYVGSFRTTGTVGQTEDSYAKRYVWNYYNREMRPLKRLESTPSWAYSTTAYRQSNANTANQVDCVIGIVEEAIYINATSIAANNTTTGRACAVGIGIDSTTINSATKFDGNLVTSSLGFVMNAYYADFPTAGRHFYTWLEKGGGVNIQTWSGTTLFASASLVQTGIIGQIRG